MDLGSHVEAAQQDRAFWSTQTVHARLQHVLELRRMNYGTDRVSSRLLRVLEIAQRFLLTKREELAALPYMHPGRVDVIAAGSLVLSRVMIATGAKEFVASESDILDGIAWALVEQV